MKTKKCDAFCKRVRERSKENKKSIIILHRARLYGNSISVLRQELDSLIRVIYLLAIKNINKRYYLIELSNAGKKWVKPDTQKTITDRDMVELASGFHGWTKSVYKFGCAFIHLSNLHDYTAQNPMDLLPAQEKKDILEHMRNYHGGPLSDEPSFEEIVNFLPQVFDKINSNLECYLEMLEADKTMKE